MSSKSLTNNKKKHFLFIPAIFLICIAATLSTDCNLAPQNNNILTDSISELRDTVSKEEFISIVGVGDIMLGTDYPSTGYLPPKGNCTTLLTHVKDYLGNADITFGNVEGVFAGSQGKAKACNNPSQCYVFRMPEKYMDCIIDAGFDLVSVANNHVNDFGYGGRKNSEKVLNESGVTWAGFIETPYAILDKDGKKYGFCAFAPHSGTADFRNLSKAKEIVRMLDSITDIVVVSFHSGAEGKNHQHVPRTDEIFLGHNRGSVYKFAHGVIDAGADIVFGHGPHVTRAVEVYKDRFIAYSLGNFCTYRRFNLSGPNGYAPIINVNLNAKGEFQQARITPIFQEGEGIPKYDSLRRAIKKIQSLTKTDFPESQIIIEDDGMIHKN